MASHLLDRLGALPDDSRRARIAEFDNGLDLAGWFDSFAPQVTPFILEANADADVIGALRRAAEAI